MFSSARGRLWLDVYYLVRMKQLADGRVYRDVVSGDGRGSSGCRSRLAARVLPAGIAVVFMVFAGGVIYDKCCIAVTAGRYCRWTMAGTFQHRSHPQRSWNLLIQLRMSFLDFCFWFTSTSKIVVKEGAASGMHPADCGGKMFNSWLAADRCNPFSDFFEEEMEGAEQQKGRRMRRSAWISGNAAVNKPAALASARPVVGSTSPRILPDCVIQQLWPVDGYFD